MIYQPEEEEETLGNTTSVSLPPFLASQLSQSQPEEEATGSETEWEQEIQEV